MKKAAMTVAMVLGLFLAGCAGDEPHYGGGSRDPFLRADRDGDAALNYQEFKHHAGIQARTEGADAMNRRSAEQMAGNRALQSQFLFLDRNNDGRVSQDEMNGY